MCGVLFGLYLLYRSEVEHHLPALSFQIKVKNKRLKRHTCLKALQDKGSGGWRFVCPNATHATQTPHKRHPRLRVLPTGSPQPDCANKQSRLCSSIEPAPAFLQSL